MHAFVRNGDILCDLFLPKPDKSNGVGIVWCPGLPNTPTVDDMSTPLSNTGFTVLQVRYPGSWHSYGKFGPSNTICRVKVRFYAYFIFSHILACSNSSSFEGEYFSGDDLGYGHSIPLLFSL